MTDATIRNPHPSFHGLTRLLEWLRSARGRAAHRRAVRKLEMLSNHYLGDIGMDRQDLPGSFAAPSSRDVATQLEISALMR